MNMRFVVIAGVVSSSISLAGCFEATGFGSLGRAPDTRMPKRSSPVIQDCVHVPFPQCGGN
jgi:hypothetical protein